MFHTIHGKYVLTGKNERRRAESQEARTRVEDSFYPEAPERFDRAEEADDADER